MRAVTFAQKDVIEFVDANFVATWYNQDPRTYPPTSPGAVNSNIACNCLAPQGIARGAEARQALVKANNLPPGTGATNVKIFFCTHDGKILNYLQGHWTPKEFVQHARFALSLLKIYEENSGSNVQGDLIKFHRECEQGHREAAAKAQRELQGSPNRQPLVEELNAQTIRAQCHVLSVQRLLQDPKPYMREDVRILR